MATFEESLVTELSAIAGLSNKIFPVTAQQGTQVPFLIYELNNIDRTMVTSGFDGLIESTYQIMIAHTTYSSLKSLTKLVTDKLKTFQQRNIGVYVQEIDIISQSEHYDDPSLFYLSQIDFQVNYTET